MNMVVDGNNNNSSLDYSAASIVHDCHATELLCLGMKRASRLPPEWLLMDSCSTVHLICDRELLTNVHDVEQDIMVHCNVGAIKLTQMGYLGDFLTPVWYHPQGIMNIMSMDDVATQFRMTLDSWTSNALCLHSLDGKCIAFMPSAKGLYKHVLTSITDITTFWSNLQCVDNANGHTFIETIADHANKYTHWDINLTHAAWCLQNITM